MAMNHAGQRLAIHSQPLGRRTHGCRATVLGRVGPNAGVRNGFARMLRVQPQPCIISCFNLGHNALPSVGVVFIAYRSHILPFNADRYSVCIDTSRIVSG